MHERFLNRILPLTLIGMNFLVAVFGVVCLVRSPYTGIRLASDGREVFVAGIDQESPAFEKIRKGDRLIEIAGLPISPSTFQKDPDDIGTRDLQRRFWQFVKRIDVSLQRGRPVELAIVRDRMPLRILIAPGPFSFRSALSRVWSVFLAGWLYLLIGYLVFRKKTSDITIANFVNGCFVCLSLVTMITFTSRDIAFSYRDFRILYGLNAVAALIFSASFIHLMLVFPAKKKILGRYPRFVYAPYAAAFIVLFLHFAEAFENRFLTIHVPMSVSMAILTGRLLYDYITEQSVLHRKQIQWVALGGITAAAIWLGLTSVPVMLRGAPFVNAHITVLFMLIYPLTLAAAIMRYRLMDIESIFDYAVVYGLTLLVLAGVEMAFLSVVSPLMFRSELGLAGTSSMAVLIIVFVYAPLRNVIRKGVERLYKRGAYDINREASKLYMRIGTPDGLSIFDHFASFARGLLASSGILILELDESGNASLRYENGKAAENACGIFLPRAGRIWEGFCSGRSCMMGYECMERLNPGLLADRLDLEHALFVSLPVHGVGVAAGYLAVLLRKWNGLSYSNKDMALMDAVTPNISGIIIAEELQREKEKLEIEYAKQRQEIIGEMHDGLGNILTTITVAAQIAGLGFHKDPDRTRAMISRIEGHSMEGLDFLRTGLTIMENPDADIDAVAATVEHRYGDLFAAHGMSLEIAIDDAVRRVHAGALNNIHILRTIQESISNIVRHARAKQVSIHFFGEQGELVVAIRDDGVGFDLSVPSSGLGLRSMEKRITGIGGRFGIAASPGAGVQVRICLPAISG